MANQLNVNDQVVPVVAENDVIVDYVSPNLLADTPEARPRGAEGTQPRSVRRSWRSGVTGDSPPGACPFG